MENYQIDNLIAIVRTLLFMITGFGGVTLVLRTWFKGRGKIAESQMKHLLESMESLHEAVDDLREQQGAVQQLNDRVGEISDRVEFAERMLSKGGN